MPKFIDISGQRFHRLTAIRKLDENKGKKIAWLFLCDCGKEHASIAQDVKSGKTKSCGCHKISVSTENILKCRQGNPKHLLHGIDGYVIWKSMRQRCLNPQNQDYADYGARGITVDQRWDDFAVFISDMGPRPSKKHSIDRRDNSKGYSLENCRWATPTEQANNRRKRRYGHKPRIT